MLNFNPDDADFDAAIAHCVAHLKSGKLVAMPTETVYGLAGDATNGAAVARIFEAKQRPQFNPLIAHVSGLKMAGTVGKIDAIGQKLVAQFWPGPLTLVVDKNPTSKVHDLVCGGLETVAIRSPGKGAGKLIEAFGAPLAAPSANRSGRVSPTSAQHVMTEFDRDDILVLDGGRCQIGIESTIVRVEKDRVIVLRAGAITAEELTQCTGMKVDVAGPDAEISAPGMMASHYAPRSKLVTDCSERHDDAAYLSFGPQGIDADYNLSKSGNLCEAASNLYGYIRELDALGKTKICVAPIPMKGLGIAINDRLRRAAAPRKGGAADG